MLLLLCFQQTTVIPEFYKEGQFSSGVAATKKILIDGNEIEQGVRIRPFVYSGKEIVSLSKCDKLVETEIKRVIELHFMQVNKSGWVKGTTPKNVFWEDDP